MARTPVGSRLRELSLLFLKLGTIGFGGPAAHIALMEREVVDRRAWITRGELLDLVGATNLIPGPNSTELAIHIGRRIAGVPGLLTAGAAFIFPAFCIVSMIGWGYERYGRLPQTTALLHGIKPVVIAIVVQALFRLARTAIKSPALGIAGLAALVAALAGVGEVTILAATAIATALTVWVPRGPTESGGALLTVPVWTAAAQTAANASAVAPLTLFLVFAKAGSLLFGSGYVLLAFLRADLVERLGWLTNAQLLDAIVVGQVTPGPVFTTATFIGYHLGGMSGAVIATAGIFLPAFVFVALSAPFIAAMRRSRVTSAILDGVNVASLALMAAVTASLARDVLVDAMAIAIAVVSAAVLVRSRVSSSVLIVVGAALGLLFG